jgi:hypothetical protein
MISGVRSVSPGNNELLLYMYMVKTENPLAFHSPQANRDLLVSVNQQD